MPEAPPETIDLYDFDLPPDRIAQRPAGTRDGSRLMVLAGGRAPESRTFRDLPDLLAPGDLLVRNDARVLPARLLGRRGGGGKAELLLVEPLPGEDRWLCLARPASHLRPGREVTFGDGGLIARIEAHRGAGRVEAAFRTTDGSAFYAALTRHGEMPLPPYIRRESGPDAEDRERYQTTYARADGAVAAPTAGLHFTPELDARLLARGIGLATVTLRVGPGTFRPMTAERLDDHRMESEFYDLPAETVDRIEATKRSGARVIAVGTTAARALEGAAAGGGLRPGSGRTDLFIRPGFRPQVIDGLVTNFHLPRSSLLVLVSALLGRERTLAAYRQAVAEGYRFYSYGDAMLCLPA